MVKKPILVSLLIALLLTVAGYGQGETYKIDASHSKVGFSVTHMVISEVEGSFGEYDATLVLDENDMSNSSVNATIQVASIDTDNEKRDGHLRSPDFFDAENHAEITFASTSVEKKGDGSYVAHGSLTIRGTTKEVSMPFTVKGPIQDPWGNTKIGVAGELSIDRQEYGLSWSKALETGGLVVDNIVKIFIKAEMAKQQS